jgi:hypothetical protein
MNAITISDGRVRMDAGTMGMAAHTALAAASAGLPLGRCPSISARSRGEDGDLFWATLGGGGGNFGIVTALDFSTVDIRDLTFTIVVMRWPSSDMAALIEGWTAWNADPNSPTGQRCITGRIARACNGSRRRTTPSRSLISPRPSPRGQARSGCTERRRSER